MSKSLLDKKVLLPKDVKLLEQKLADLLEIKCTLIYKMEKLEKKISNILFVIKTKGLKPCPFCGHKVELLNTDDSYHIACTNDECFCATLSSNNPEDVLIKWNTRKE